MEKKNFKVYETPAVEVVEMETVGSLLTASEDIMDVFPPVDNGDEV